MAVGDDPLRRALSGIGSASDLLRAAQGFDGTRHLIERALGGHRYLQDMLAIRPTLIDEIAGGRDRMTKLLEQRPGIVEEMARRNAEFEKLASGGAVWQAAGRLTAYEEAIAGIDRLGSSLPRVEAYERLLGARVMIPDAAGDILARYGGLAGIVERFGAAGALEEGYAAQFAGFARMVDEATGAVPARDALSRQFPDLLPALRLPTTAEIAGVDLAAAAGLRDPGKVWLEATAAQLAAIETPWVREDRPELSIEGYAAFKGLTEIVGRTAPEAPRVTQLVRAELGDYRREDEADEVVDDPILATGLRMARGFDLRLASLPMALVGHIFVPFGMVVGTAPDADPEELDAALALMFRQLERKLRAFIDRVMRQGVGERWIRQRVHKDIREEWERRRQKDIDDGRAPGELFDYADFGDYRRIIEQGDNWKDAFQSVFKVKTAIGETLGRLSVIRNPVAHVRPVSIEDLLVLRVEGRRLYIWIGEVVP